MCIAVIEPDPTLRWLIGEWLRDNGYTVEEYRSAAWHEQMEVAIFGPNFEGPIIAPLQKVASIHFPHGGSIEYLSKQVLEILPDREQQKS